MTARVTVISSSRPARLTKAYSLTGDGSLQKQPAGAMVEGRAEVVAVGSLSEFATLLTGLSPAQALTYGRPAEAPVTLTTQERWVEAGRPAGMLPRTNKTFAWPPGPGVLMLDHDPGPGQASLSRDDLAAAVRAAVPGLADAAMIWWASASSHIIDTRTGDDLTGLRGQRLYLMLADATDIPRAGAAMVDHLWAAGHGYIVVSKSGALLERTIVDAAVWQPSRLDFAAGATCRSPLQQDRGPPVPMPGAVEIVDSRAAIPDPRPETITLATAARERAKRGAKGESDAAKAEWIGDRVAEMVPPDADEGLLEAARQIAARALEHRTLAGDFPVTVVSEQDEIRITVGQALDDPLRWHGARTLDPLEPDYDGRRAVGKLYLMGSRPNLYSFAHGGTVFRLARQPARVELVRGRTHDAVLATLDIMRRTPDVFDFGGALVAVDGARLWPMDEAGLTFWLGGATQFWRWHQLPKGDPVEVLEDPPSKVAKPILSLGAGRRLKSLQAVITAPTLRPDGTVLDHEGYDPDTGLLLEPDGELVPVSDSPTLGDVNRALDALMYPFEKFPLENAGGWGVLLAAVLTAAVRPALPTCPAFGFDAPTQGSGKTLLASCISILATGETPTIWPHTAGRDDEEVRKRLFSALRSGDRCIVWDNVTGVFDSAALAGAITAPMFKDRVLGKSESPSVPNRAIIVLTGNNLALAGDMPRRVLMCRVDPQTDRPFAREFDLDPMAYCMARRQEMVSAALTILRGYMASGAGRAPGRMASFEAWDDRVRQTVAWIGRDVAPGAFGDPMDSVIAAQESDPDQDNLRALLTALGNRYPKMWVTARDLAELVAKKANDSGLSAVERELVDVLTDMLPRTASSRSIGRVLHFRKGRIVAGMRLVEKHERGGNVYRVDSVA